jgi:rfaE bifunctional protein nucleotidyltransferase chain/domain
MSLKFNDKFIDPEKLEEVIRNLRKQGKRVVSLNGSFDLMHAGHLYILYEAKKQGDVLIVALNSDESIRQYKNIHRPIIPLEYRIQMMAAIEVVDYVTYFHETAPMEILKKIHPDVHVNGAEYGASCVEAETVEQLGARLHLVDRIPSLSTSSIINKIRSLCD